MTEDSTNSAPPESAHDRRIKKAMWLRCLRWLIRLSLLLLVATTTVLTAGRLLIPRVSGQLTAVEQQLANMLGTDVVVGQLTGDWYRFTPVLLVDELTIVNPEQPESSHVIKSIILRPALLSSLLARRLIVERVVVEEPGLELVQNSQGAWSLGGLAAGDTDYTDTIVDFLLSTGQLQIAEADLTLKWNDGKELQLENIYLDISNAGGTHLAVLQARVESQASPFMVQIELTGDPRTQYSATAHLQTNGLDVADLVNVSDFQLDSGRFGGELWASIEDGNITSIQGVMHDVALSGQGQNEFPLNLLALSNTSFTFAAKAPDKNLWQFWLQNIEMDWNNRPWETGNVFMELDTDGDQRPLNITADSINLGMMSDVFDDLLVLPERAAAALSDLSPEGRLVNVNLQTDLRGGFADLFLLQANLENVAVGAWQGAPSGRGIQGYVEASASRGTVELDSSDFEIHLPRLFRESWRYDSANSRVHWQLGDGSVHINSSIIDVRNEHIHGHVQFDLYNHRDSEGVPQSELTLLIGVMEMDASYKSLYLPTLEKVEPTMRWLEEALLAGDISRSGFVSRTSTRGGAPENSGTILSFYHVDNGELAFDPQWPPLEGITAFVNVDNNQVDVFAESAMIADMALEDVNAAVRPNEAGGSWISVTGFSDTSTDRGLAFLRNTPVRNSIGDFLDDWQGSGNIHVDIGLGIPLNNTFLNTDVDVKVVSNLSTLTIPEYALSIDDLRGSIVYDSEAGLSANALSGRLFDFPIAATIEPTRDTIDSEISGTRIVGSGRASRNALQSWEGQPDFVRDLLNFANGEIDYLAEIMIPYSDGNNENTTTIRLTSELLGLSLDLPPPFRKSIDNIRPLELLISFEDASQWVSARFDNRVGANILIQNDLFSGGHVVFGSPTREMNFGPVLLADDGLVFDGNLEQFVYEDWVEVASRFTDMSMNPDAQSTRLEDFLSLADIHVGTLTVAGQELESVQTRVSRTGLMDEVSEAGASTQPDSWQVNLENSLLNGAFVFPDDETLPWRVDLDYLRFPDDSDGIEEGDGDNSDAGEEDVDVLADVNPAELPDMNFRTQELSLGDKHLGAWEFNLRADGNSATVSDLKMTTSDARIRDGSEAGGGANLDWRYNNSMHTSSFTGVFNAGDLARVLPELGYDANVESDSARFVSNFQWTGSPASFSLDKVIGNVDVDIRDGRFVDIDSGGSRLFGAFSFDSLVRRLQLDFSDLYKKGLAYDRIGGSLGFDRGIVTTDGEFVVEAPSSRITIDGEIDLINETIDADLLVNVPLGQNLSVLAGILGAWPIAVSTFLASQLFEEQMDDFTTVLYRLEGPWDDPTSMFEPTEELLESSAELELEQGQPDNPAP